jgi:hypothetical protein
MQSAFLDIHLLTNMRRASKLAPNMSAQNFSLITLILTQLPPKTGGGQVRISK